LTKSVRFVRIWCPKSHMYTGVRIIIVCQTVWPNIQLDEDCWTFMKYQFFFIADTQWFPATTPYDVILCIYINGLPTCTPDNFFNRNFRFLLKCKTAVFLRLKNICSLIFSSHFKSISCLHYSSFITSFLVFDLSSLCKWFKYHNIEHLNSKRYSSISNNNIETEMRWCNILKIFLLWVPCIYYSLIHKKICFRILWMLTFLYS